MKRTDLFYIRLSFIVSIFICAVKFVAWAITGSLVILSDALESIINVAAAAFAWYSIYLSNKPRDTEHPYGHGKIEFFSIGFEGAMILIAGIGILVQAVQGFIHPQSLKGLTTGLWLTVAGGAANFILGYFLVQTGKNRNSLTLTGNGKHILSDSYSSIGVLVAVVLILLTGYSWIDPVASVFAAAVIIYTGFRLMRKSVKGLMDEVDMKVVDELVEILKLNRKAAWIDVHNMRVQRFGNYYHVDCHVTMPYYYSLEQVHDELTKLDTVLNKNFQKGSIEFFIHTDPCISSSCRHCLLSECPVRKFPFQQQIEWSKENLLPNKKHAFAE
ncbi:cation transporter [Lacibacter luteus]|uniref:Cation transporter n=1 Tax=Lacibacter luteus TaxID=2508719 RepID=A0A4Q1CMA9_9BACT|nr:cation diffusion facilitator family transporter [Lacibacter luteus]RXK61865.1 cation transporter [Lacibacter luteus]